METICVSFLYSVCCVGRNVEQFNGIFMTKFKVNRQCDVVALRGNSCFKCLSFFRHIIDFYICVNGDEPLIDSKCIEDLIPSNTVDPQSSYFANGMMICPAVTSVSLLASAIVFPAPIAAIVG